LYSIVFNCSGGGGGGGGRGGSGLQALPLQQNINGAVGKTIQKYGVHIGILY
jgi:hypothetical protein